MTSHYYRSPIISFYELSEEQQKNVIEDYSFGGNELCEQSFVLPSEESTYPIPLSEFMKIDREASLFDGYYLTSNTSAYVIKLSKCNTVAVVASKYW